MLETLLTQNPTLPIILYILFSLSDYYLTLYGARLYKQFGADKIVYEKGYELNPAFQEAVDKQQFLHPQYLLRLLLSSSLLLLLHLVLLDYPLAGLRLPGLFLFLYGAFFLQVLAVNLRHLFNIWLYSHAYSLQPPGIIGKVKIMEWHAHKQMAYNSFFVDGFFCLFVFVFTGSPMFLGGAFGLSVVALRYARLSAAEFAVHKIAVSAARARSKG